MRMAHPMRMTGISPLLILRRRVDHQESRVEYVSAPSEAAQYVASLSDEELLGIVDPKWRELLPPPTEPSAE